MQTDNRAQRRKAAKAAGVKGRLVSELAIVAEPVTAVTLAGTILAVLQRLERSGGAPLEHSTITVGDDHPEHVGKIVVEGKTDRMQRQAPRTPLALGELASGGLDLGELHDAGEGMARDV